MPITSFICLSSWKTDDFPIATGRNTVLLSTIYYSLLPFTNLIADTHDVLDHSQDIFQVLSAIR